MENTQSAPDSVLSAEESLGVSSMMSTDSGGFSEHSPPIVKNDSGSVSIGTSSMAPLSPQRSNHTHSSVVSSPVNGNMGTPVQSTSHNTSPIRKSQATPGSIRVEPTNGFAVPSLEYSNSLLLGVQQPEQQDGEDEQAWFAGDISAQNQLQQPSITSQATPSLGDEDDERTEPSSTITGTTGDNPAPYPQSDPDVVSTFGRLIQNTRVSGWLLTAGISFVF